MKIRIIHNISLLLFCWMTPGIILAQKQIDSLKNVLRLTAIDSVKATLLFNIGKLYVSDAKNETALEYAKSSLSFAQKSNFKKGIAEANNLIGNIYKYQGNIPKAIEANKESLKAYEEIGDKTGAAHTYGNIGLIYDAQGNYPEALRNMLIALKALEAAGDKNDVAVINNNIGLIYLKIGNYTEAHNKFLTALGIWQQIGHKKGIGMSYNNIGNVNGAQGNYSESLKNNLASLKIKEELGDKRGIAIAYNNIGNIHRYQRNYTEALNNYLKSMEIQGGLSEKEITANTCNNIGHTYTMSGDPEKGKEWFKKGLQLSKEIGSVTYISEAYAGLAIADSIANNYKDAYHNYKMHARYKDSMFNEANTQKLTRLEVQYEADKIQDSIRFAGHQKQLALQKEMQLSNLKHEYEKKQARARSEEERRQLVLEAEIKRQKIENEYAIFEAENRREQAEQKVRQQKKDAVIEKEIALRDATLENNKKQRYFYIVGILGLLTIGGLLYHQNRLRKRKNKELDESNKVKARFFSILSHDLRAPIASLSNYIYLLNEEEDMMGDLKHGHQQKLGKATNDLLSTLEEILLWSKSQMERFEPNKKNVSVKQIFDDIKKLVPDNSNIDIVFQSPPDMDLFTDENYIKTIMRNLTANAINALKNEQEGTIRWKAYEESGKKYISISDNGPGLTSAQRERLFAEEAVISTKTGLGLHLVRDLIKMLRHDLAVTSEQGKGTTLTIIFK